MKCPHSDFRREQIDNMTKELERLSKLIDRLITYQKAMNKRLQAWERYANELEHEDGRISYIG